MSSPVPPAIGYAVKMFPRLSETFILNEVLELEQQGVRLHIFSLKRPADSVAHAQTQAVRSPITYLPERIYHAPWRIAQAQFHVWRHHRAAWQHTLRNALRRVRAGGDSAAWLPFCQACCIIREMDGLGHLHAHYANAPAKVALLVHRLTGLSYSITTHAKDIFQNDPFASPKLHERLSRARFVIANSRFSANHIAAHLGCRDRIQTVYNGLDLRAFPQRNGAPLEPVILSVGRLVEKKGFSTLIAACSILKQRGVTFTCELVGTGPLSQPLKDQIRTTGLTDRLKMFGPLPQQVLREHYARAMVFALPCLAASDGDRDVLPNVLKEAMAVGVPVVTSRLEGIEELIEDGVSGLLVAPRDEHGLADQLESLLRDSQLRRRLAAQARTVVEERFDRRRNFAQLKTLLLGALQPESTQPHAPGPAEVASHDANCLR
jgi:glycosyltransferase involved in cell wall biosynthesis